MEGIGILVLKLTKYVLCKRGEARTI